MSIGAQLEGSSLEWLQQLDVLESNGVNRTNRVLRVGAQNMLNQLNGAYKKLQDSKGTNNRYVAQQAAARLASMSDLLPPKQKRALVEAQKAELAKAQQMGGKSGVDLARITKDGSLTLKENAKPNLNAIDNAGKRLNDFWSKENQSFRDRVTALTQVNLAEGKSYRHLAGQVRNLLLLEKQQGTESARSSRVNQKMGISQRAEVIARTEMQTAFVQGQINNYRGLGYAWARWSAAAERTCGYCMSRDGLVFEMEEIEGSIPAHPRCRCTLIPVEKPPGIGDKKPSQLQADEFLDDKYWQKSRKDKLDRWKDDQNKTKSGQPKPKELLKSNSDLDQALRRYERTPTNQQEYLRPGSDAPQPKWKPSGDTIPDLVKAQKAALKEQQQLVGAMKRAANQTQGVVKKRPGETETFKKHSNAEGGEPGPDTVWTPERQKLHAEILDHFLKNGVVSDNPTFTMSGGGPASGKGFMLKKTGLEKPGRVILDADEIKKLIPEYAAAQKKGGKAQQKAASQVHEESSYLAKKLMAEAANRGFDVVLDGTGDNGLKSLKKKVDNMRAKGYRVEAKYVSADTDVAAQRNWDRFLKTGRLPPEHMLRNVHRDVSKTLPEAMDAGIFDAVELYDTNKSGELRLVASQKNGGKQTIHDKKLWDDFKRKGEAETWTSEQGERAITQRKLKENPKASDTAQRHSSARGKGVEPDPSTVWTAERQKLHDDIVKHFLKDGKVSKNPTFTMSGGGPASGKGFMLKKTGLDQPGKVVIDADEIKKLIPEYAEMQKAGGKKGLKAAAYVHEESSYLAKRIMGEAADAGFDVVLDGTGDNGVKSLGKKVKKMREKGYRVEAKYVSADTEVAVQRNWDRFLKTGRLPPEHMLRNVHRDVSRTVPKALADDLFDSFELFDTNQSGELRRILHKDKGSKTVVDDPKLLHRFLDKGKAQQVTEADVKRMQEARQLKELPTASDSAGRHSNARGKGAEPGPDTIWTHDRKKLHDEIVNKFLKDGVVSNDPTFTMSGGGPASGKGFMLKKTGLDKPGKVVVDSDEIKKLIPEYAEMQKAGGAKAKKAAGYVHEESSYLAKRVMDEASSRGFDVILDGTGDNGLASLKKKVDKMRAKGYKVEAKYVSADTEVAAQRNWERFLKTGRLPPESMLRNVHRDVSRTLPDAIDADLFDKVELFDTNKTGELRKVLSKTQGSKATIHDDVLWQRFKRKADVEQTFTSADDAALTAAQEKRMPKLPDAPKPKPAPKPKKVIEDRIAEKFVEPPSAKIKSKDFADGLKQLKAQGGDVGTNIDRFMRFQERYNLSTITGTGNEKPGYFLGSKQLQSSVAAAQARKTATNKIGYGNDKVFAEALREMRSSTLEVNQLTARTNFKVSKTVGVGGSTADGMGAVKIKISKHHQKLTPDRLAELQAAVERSVIDSAAGKPHVLTSHSTFNTKVKGAKSEVDWFTNYIHEMGHQIHYAAGQPMPNSVSAQNWKPSKYGATNKQEWFAETFTQYALAPAALKKANPRAYKFIDDTFRRVMAGRPGEVGRAEALGVEAPQRTLKEDFISLKGKTVKQLQADAKAAGLKGYSKLKKPELEALLDTAQQNKNVDIATSVMTNKKFKSDKARIAEMKRLGVPAGSDFVGLVAQAKAAQGLKPTQALKAPAPVASKAGVTKKPAAKPKAAPKAKTVTQLKAEAKAAGLKGYSKLKKPELEAALAKAKEPKVAGIKKKPSATAAKKPAAKKKTDFQLVSEQLGLSKTQWDAKSDGAKKMAVKSAQNKIKKNAGKSLKQLQAEVKAAKQKADEAQKQYEETIQEIANNKAKLKAEAMSKGKGSGTEAKQKRIKELNNEIGVLSAKAFTGKYTKADGVKVKALQAERDALQQQLKPKKEGKVKLPKKTDDIDFLPDPSDFEAYGFESEKAMDQLFETVDHWSGEGYKNIRKMQISKLDKKLLTPYEKGMVDRYNKSTEADWAGDERMAKEIETYIKNAPKYDGEVMRGQFVDNAKAAEAVLSQLNNGRPSPAIESWSNDIDTANNFATGKDTGRKFLKGNVGLLFKMKNKEGVPIAGMSGMATENEVLMPSGVRTKVKSVTKTTQNGKEIWEVELVSS